MLFIPPVLPLAPPLFRGHRLTPTNQQATVASGTLLQQGIAQVCVAAQKLHASKLTMLLLNIHTLIMWVKAEVGIQQSRRTTMWVRVPGVLTVW